MRHIIGKNIAYVRRKKGWTQAELAEKLNVSDKTVSKWESCQGCPSIDFLPDIARLFDITIDWLLGYEVLCEVENKIVDTASEILDFKDYNSVFILGDVGTGKTVLLKKYIEENISKPNNTFFIFDEKNLEYDKFKNSEFRMNVKVCDTLNDFSNFILTFYAQMQHIINGGDNKKHTYHLIIDELLSVDLYLDKEYQDKLLHIIKYAKLCNFKIIIATYRNPSYTFTERVLGTCDIRLIFRNNYGFEFKLDTNYIDNLEVGKCVVQDAKTRNILKIYTLK